MKQMIVTVRFFTTLRELARKREEEVELESAVTVGDLMSILSEKHGRQFTDYLYDQKGNVRSYLMFLVNGKSITTLQGLKTELRDRDKVAILPPVGGG